MNPLTVRQEAEERATDRRGPRYQSGGAKTREWEATRDSFIAGAIFGQRMALERAAVRFQQAAPQPGFWIAKSIRETPLDDGKKT